ncbi:MAG: hypothetical protein PVS2B3_05910 [Steroidobacteraceae bacterium]
MAWQSLAPFCKWLAGTPLSQTIQTVGWIIPAVQTVHIVAVACVVTSALMISLRLLGVGRHDQPVAAVTGRFLPFLWWPLPVLAGTGAVLIAAEPARSLQNPVFALKMSLILVAAGVTLLCQLPLRNNATFWELAPARRVLARLLAVVSIALWVAIIFAGRWIAYIQGS